MSLLHSAAHRVHFNEDNAATELHIENGILDLRTLELRAFTPERLERAADEDFLVFQWIVQSPETRRISR
jgi:hypothetical protein